MFTASSQSKSKEGSIKETKVQSKIEAVQSKIEAATFASSQRTLEIIRNQIRDDRFVSEPDAAEHIKKVCAAVQLFCKQSVLKAEPGLVASLLHRAGVILDKCRSSEEIGWLAATQVSLL